MAKQKTGKAPDPIKSLRKPYTTMINTSLLKRLRIQAIEKGVTTADLLEGMIKKYLTTKKN